MNAESEKFETVADVNDTKSSPLVLFIVILGVLLYGCFLYIDRYAGDFNPLVYAPYQNLKQVADAHPQTADPGHIKDGERIYSTLCMVCHQATGSGVAGQFPPLAGSKWVNEKNPWRLIRIPQSGLSGAITIKGQEWNLAMPNMGASLSDEDLAALLSYIRQAWGNKASIVTPEQVKKVRQEISSHPNPWTQDELKAVPVE